MADKVNVKVKKTDNTQAKSSASQENEAKALLAKMQAKQDAGDCPFC